MNRSPYLHILDGRIRIKIPAIKGSHQKAVCVEQSLRSLEGVYQVQANSVTGNVLILFDSNRVTACEVLKVTDSLGAKWSSHNALKMVAQTPSYLFTLRQMQPTVLPKLWFGR